MMKKNIASTTNVVHIPARVTTSVQILSWLKDLMLAILSHKYEPSGSRGHEHCLWHKDVSQ